jgi:oligopeptide transport system permease protein
VNNQLLRYSGKRVLQALPVFLGATFILYALIFLQPGDPVRAMFGEKPPSPATIAMIRHQYHLDQPFIVQYLYFLKGIVTLDFGKTFAGRDVLEVIATVMPNTLALGVVAFVIEILIGVGFGVVCGLKKGTLFDNGALLVSLVLVSIPPLVLGFLLQYLLGIKMKVIPVTVGSNIDLYHLIVPGLIIATVSIATIIRLTRSSVSEIRGADFVRTARSKGLQRGQVTRNHVFRNSLIPVVTYLGGDFVAILSGAILTEAIFNINGIGNTMLRYVLNGEGAVVVSIASFFLLMYVVMNILVDILYAVLDPRIRVGKGTE